jgi:aromatic ring-opening dioxygenase catalytic subunit (LigB family)
VAHPREEHLLPLMVAAGAAGEDVGQRIYSERLGGVLALSGYRFG